MTNVEELKKTTPLPSKIFFEIIGELLEISAEKARITYRSLELSSKQIIKFKKIEGQAKTGTPFPYLFKKAWFCGNVFYIDKNVLIPRFETELVIAEAEKFLRPRKDSPSILDLGTGSGCIAITLKIKHEKAKITAVDISPLALNIARKNSSNHKTDISFSKSDLFEKVDGKFDLIVANLPYIASEDQDLNVLEDPIIALDGGEKGFELIKKTIQNLRPHLKTNGLAIFEIGYNQKDLIEECSSQNGFSCRVLNDLNGYPRVALLS